MKILHLGALLLLREARVLANGLRLGMRLLEDGLELWLLIGGQVQLLRHFLHAAAMTMPVRLALRRAGIRSRLRRCGVRLVSVRCILREQRNAKGQSRSKNTCCQFLHITSPIRCMPSSLARCFLN